MRLRLEYRLADEDRQYPLLYIYEVIDKDEIGLRFACDYYVKDGAVYEAVHRGVEPGRAIVYVRRADDEQASVYPMPVRRSDRTIVVEFREYRESSTLYPLIETFEFGDDDDCLLYLQSDSLYVNGRHWRKTSTEIDEDRGAYVIYAEPQA
ncbi:hypothetical protein ACFQWB_05410 [Paenibacillus thermoaerophilus]|uniref:Uncharacterized protein n=1 Tax=Paenibacillus thermoaerophilus TaxID=1215385 RepID=A0ABW2UZR4_9BACL|nr:hypothetical protein [Paenibacillus thermoaerophilus]TMV08252.1 hypothetical protein FE781_15335 [Paenibacillus thermoaerophilus]